MAVDRTGTDLTIVTGAAGFIGSTLCRNLLDSGHRVRAIDSFTDFYPRSFKEANLAELRNRDGFEFHEGDLLELSLDSLLEGVDVVYHLAAQAGVRTSWGTQFEDYVRFNVLATQRLLESLKEHSLRRFVYASSSSVYGDVSELPMRESARPAPRSPYGVSKLAAEHLAQLYWNNYDIPTVSLRYFTVYGPRQRPDMAFYRFMDAGLHGRDCHLYGDGEQTRDFTFVEDAVDATIRAGSSGKAGGIYNIGGGSRVSLSHVFDLLNDILPGKLKVIREDVVKGDVRDTSADTTLAAEELGFSPRVSLSEGLRLQFEWMSDNHEKQKKEVSR